MSGWLAKRLGNGLFGIIDIDNPYTSPSECLYNELLDYDSNGNVIYEGWAVPGSLSSAAVWRIRKTTYTLTSGIYVKATVKWAGGNSDMVNIWDNRAGLTYS